MEVKTEYDTADLEPCARLSEEDLARPRTGHHPPRRLAGGLGLVEWVEEFATIMQTLNEDPTAATYNVSFQIDRSLTLVPTITFSSGDAVGGDARDRRTVKHQLVVTVTELKKGEAPPTAAKRAFDIQENYLGRMSL